MLCLFKGRGIFYIVCEIATTCCDEQKGNEQAAIETMFFHEPASAGFQIVLRIFTYISPTTAFVNVFIVFSSICFFFPAYRVNFTERLYQLIFFPIEREWNTNVNRILNYTFNSLSLII